MPGSRGREPRLPGIDEAPGKVRPICVLWGYLEHRF